MNILTFASTTFGAQTCRLDLAALYPQPEGRDAFERRLEAFLAAEALAREIFTRSGDTLHYTTEVFVSPKLDERPPLLLLLGNPATHSVKAGLCFASEKDGREHRFWRVLRQVGLLDTREHTSLEARKQALWELEYESPFRMGVAMFYSMPSPASGRKWSGVVGLRKLFRAKALREIAAYEQERVQDLVSRFMPSGGGILAFQKDAYEGVRSLDTPPYSIDGANRGALVGRYRGDQTIRLACAPPTRNMYARATKRVLTAHKAWFAGVS